jgi:hypothetical protein
MIHGINLTPRLPLLCLKAKERGRNAERLVGVIATALSMSHPSPSPQDHGISQFRSAMERDRE